MTPRIFTPGPHQIAMIEHALEHPRCAIWAGMGMGKTSSALTVLNGLQLLEPGLDLVLAPKRVAKDTWPNETQKWASLRNLEIVPVIGTESERIAALKADASTNTINYDNLPWLIEYLLVNKLPWRWSRVVADESTRLKNFRLRGGGGQRARAIARVTHTRVKRWINLTGMPSPNGLKDLWGQTWFLDAGARLGKSFTAFEQRWFAWLRRPAPGKQHEAMQIALPGAQQQIEAQLRDICITLDPKDYFDIQDPIVSPVYVDLPAKARFHYQEMERKMFTEIKQHEIEAMTAAARTMKCLQLANGAVYIDDSGAWVETHDAKLQALESIVEEAAGMPVLVAIQFKSDRARILRAFPGAVDVATDSGMATFRAGRAPIGIGHPASMGHGIDGLQDVTNICAIFGHWWNLEEYAQFIARIGPVRQQQSGHNRPTHVYPIVARDTIDELVMARRESKREVQDLLLEAMKRRGT